MSQRKLNLVATLMAFSLAGLLIIQFAWVRNAIRLKEAEFDNSILDSMTRIAQKTGVMQRANYIFNMSGNDTLNSFTTEIKYKFSNNDDIIESKHDIIKKPLKQDRVEWLHSDNEGKAVKRVQVITNNSTNVHQEFIHNDVEFNGNEDVVIIASADSEIIHIEEIVERVDAQTKAFEHTFRKLALEYITDTIDLESLIDMEQLEKVLREELNQNNISAPFYWQLIEGETFDSLMAVTKQKGSKQFMVNLFPEKVYSKPTILKVTIETGFLNSMRYLGGIHFTSLIFSFIIIVSFIYTYRLLLTQRKITEMKSDFINNMTHEFKTPIATINLAIDSINNPQIIQSQEKIKHFTGIIRDENMRMNQQVEKVLQMSAIEKQELFLQPIEISLNELVLSVIDTFKLIMQQRQGTFKIDLKASNDFIEADKEHLYNVIRNLIDNAIKYCEEQPHIVVHTESNEQGLSLIVTDNGIGISAKDQQHVFERFFRVHTGDVHNIKGFGLGLNYVKEVLDRMGAVIKLKSRPGSGTEVKIEFDRKK